MAEGTPFVIPYKEGEIDQDEQISEIDLGLSYTICKHISGAHVDRKDFI